MNFMKTQLDIYRSANAAAATTLEVNTPYEVTTAALKAFQAEKQDPKDYELWQRMFNEARALMLNLRGAKAPSENKG